MFYAKIAPALLLLTFAANIANAQTVSFTNTYHVQVKVEMWTSGATAWQTQFSTTNYADAQMMQALLEVALESDELSEIMGLSFYYIATDIRISTEYPEQLRWEARRYPSIDQSYSQWRYQAP